jgi:hypothetical protein
MNQGNNQDSNFQYKNSGDSLNLNCNSDITRQLFKNPSESLESEIGGRACKIQIVSPHYVELVCQYYADQLLHDLNFYHDSLKIPVLFSHFGLRIDFIESTELHLHDENMILPDSVKDFLKNFGAVIFRNAYLDSSVRDMGHRNRFPQLNFHVDRIPSQVSYYSVYTRNPFDEEQENPRTSSTLFVPMLVAYLQGLSEGKTTLLSDEGLINNAMLYDEESIKPILNTIAVEHSWDRPMGTGEISIINNCNVLHSSYYPDIYDKGYRIGVRYLA